LNIDIYKFFQIYLIKKKNIGGCKLKERILATSKLTIRSQITIPKIVREKLKVSPGDIVVFIERDGEIIIRRSELTL